MPPYQEQAHEQEGISISRVRLAQHPCRHVDSLALSEESLTQDLKAISPRQYSLCTLYKDQLTIICARFGNC